MINRKIHVLKGQHNLAQGNALGLEIGEKIVREFTFIEEKFIFRTSVMTSCFPGMMSCNCVRRKLSALFNEFSRTIFVILFYTGRFPGLIYIGR